MTEEDIFINTTSEFYEKLQKGNSNINLIQSINDNLLKEIIVFYLDDMFVKKDITWSDRTLEQTIFSRRIGGKKFFENLDIFVSNNDMEMLKICLIALNNGFTGIYEENPSIIKNKQKEIKKLLNIKENIEINLGNYIAHDKLPEHRYWFLYILIGLFISIELIKSLLFYYSTNKIINILSITGVK